MLNRVRNGVGTGQNASMAILFNSFKVILFLKIFNKLSGVW